MNTTTNIIKNYFSGYACAVAQSRALISVEDGLKPSLRMALYANYTDNFIAPQKTAKFLKLIGSASRFCWHGDAATYGMLIRCGKPYALRYPLYDIQGSYGTLMDPDSHGAPRYVEGRISNLGKNFFTFINENVIDEWRDNYDNTEVFPSLLPSIGYWNICNGTMGIGVGINASIPQFNLKEMNLALIKMLRNEPYEIPLPDFATGGIIINKDEVKESLIKGTNHSCKIRAKINYNSDNNSFIVSEMPYAVYTNTVCQELEELIKDPTNGIDSFIDTTTQKPDIEIKLNKNAVPEQVLKLLYAKTSLQSSFPINLIMLENCRTPKKYSLPEAMKKHLDHEKKCYKRSYEYNKNILQKKLHLLEGLLVVFDNLNNIIKIIQTEDNNKQIELLLSQQYNLDKEQVQHILSLTLSKLSKMEVQKIKEKYKNIEDQIKNIDEILSDEKLFIQQIENNLKKIITEYGDERRTEILNLTKENEEEKKYYFTSNGKIFLRKPKQEIIISELSIDKEYIGISSRGNIYFLNNQNIKKAKKVFKLQKDELLLKVVEYNPNLFICIENKKFFKCKLMKDIYQKNIFLGIEQIDNICITNQYCYRYNYKNYLI